jgi:pimeloyl-ACP methyl ester carboxylesterase
MSRFIPNSTGLNFRRMGSGEDVTLIHGLATNLAFWRLEMLLPLTRKHRVTLYDLRGHGYSHMPAAGYNSAEMAEDLLRLLDYLQINRAHLIGHSFGGVVALHFATLYPDRVLSLVIADSRIRAFQPTQIARDWPHRDSAFKKLKELGLTIPEGESEAGFWLLEQLATEEWLDKRQQLKGSQLFIPFGGWNGGRRTAERWLKLVQTTSAKQEMTSLAGLTRERLATIRHRVLPIYGEHSVGLPSFYGLQDLLRNCRGILIPGAGHFFPFTRPELFAKHLEQFLDSQVQQERRRHLRQVHQLRVVLKTAQKVSFLAKTINVSQQGLLIESSRQLAVGESFHLLITMNRSGKHVAMQGTVVRQEGGKADNSRFGLKMVGEGESSRIWKNFLTHRDARSSAVVLD